MVRNGAVSNDIDGERERARESKEEQVVKWKNINTRLYADDKLNLSPIHIL